MSADRSFFTRDFDRRVWLTVAVVAFSGAVGAGLLLHASWPGRVRMGHRPDQPIAFSHQLHAGTLLINCRYCHTGVDDADHAGVPPLSTCMNCHGMFQPSPENKTAEEHKRQVERLKVLYDHWDNQRPVHWNKVYDLADFAYFPHSRHTAAGLDCRTCHGAVETMTRIEKVAPLTMGWCLRCHKGGAPIAFEEFALLAKKTGAELVRDPVFGEIVAPINCSTCHR